MTSAESMYFSSPRMSLPSVPSGSSVPLNSLKDTASVVAKDALSKDTPLKETLKETPKETLKETLKDEKKGLDTEIVTVSFSSTSGDTQVAQTAQVAQKEKSKTSLSRSYSLSSSLPNSSILEEDAGSGPSNPSSTSSTSSLSRVRTTTSTSERSKTPKKHIVKTPTKKTPRETQQARQTHDSSDENKIPRLSFDGIKNKIESHVSSRSLPALSPFFGSSNGGSGGDCSDDDSRLGDKLRNMYKNYHEKIKKERIKLKINKIETDATRLASIGKEEMIFYTPLSPTLVTELEKSGVRYIEDHKKKKYCITWVYD